MKVEDQDDEECRLMAMSELNYVARIRGIQENKKKLESGGWHCSVTTILIIIWFIKIWIFIYIYIDNKI